MRFIFIIIYISTKIWCASSYNMELKSIMTFENSLNDYGVSDVWGYTDETGIEYAIVGFLNGTSIWDVSSDPENPYEVANIPGPSSGDYYYHRDYKTFGDYLYSSTLVRRGAI